eukprot:1916101-Amphidinium_carterae.2
MVYNNVAIPTTFVTADINCAILGLDTITRNGLRLTVEGYKGYLGNDQTEVKLHYIGKHFYLRATMFDRLCNYVDYTKDFNSWYYDWYDGCKQENVVYGLDHEDIQVPINILDDQSQQKASIPLTFKTSSAPTQEEIDERNIIHLPYCDWCKHCVQGKRKKQYHQKGGLRKQNITQIDYAVLESDNDKHNATVLTIMVCANPLQVLATMVPYKGRNQEAVKAITLWKTVYKRQCHNQTENQQSLNC